MSTYTLITAGVLWCNAVLYAGFSIWCTLAPRATMRFLGLLDAGNDGFSEFQAVYGGLQAGLAVLFLMLALQPALHRHGVLFSLILYACVAGWRTAAFVLHGLPQENGVLMVYALETSLLMWSVVAWLIIRR